MMLIYDTDYNVASDEKTIRHHRIQYVNMLLIYDVNYTVKIQWGNWFHIFDISLQCQFWATFWQCTGKKQMLTWWQIDTPYFLRYGTIQYFRKNLPYGMIRYIFLRYDAIRYYDTDHKFHSVSYRIVFYDIFILSYRIVFYDSLTVSYRNKRYFTIFLLYRIVLQYVS